MADFPEAGVKLVAETDDAQSAIDSLASDLDSLTSSAYTAEVVVEVDDTAVGDVPLEDTEATATVNVETSEESDPALSALTTLKDLAVLETIWNITGTAVDLFSKFGGQVLGPMLELDEAVAKVNATTGNGIPNARELIHDIFYSDLGESIEQVADLVTTAYTIGAPVKDATEAVLQFTHTFTDQNPQTVLNTMNQMVVNKLTPDFKTAGDVLVTAFQNGADRGKDLLTAINNNATAIHDMGMTGPQALSFIKTGLDAGFISAEAVLKSLETIKKNVTNAAGNPTSDVSKTLRLLDIANPAETGEAWSAEFFQKVIDGIKNEPGLTDAEREVLFTNLIGGKQGGKVFSAFLQLSASDADKIFAEVGGASERAAAEADNHLKGAFEDFQLAVSLAVQNWLSSSAIDIPGKLDKLKQGLQDGLNTLADGGTLSEGLTIALKPLGFDDEFQGLEKALGDLVIGILQAVAMLQENPLIGNNAAAAAGTRNTIAGMAATQLQFNLKIANPDEVATEITTATSRGLSDAQVAMNVASVINDLVKTGTDEALAQAQVLVDALKAPIDLNKVPTLASGAPMNVEPVVTDTAITALQTQIDTALKQGPPPDVVDELAKGMGLQAEATTKVSTAAQQSLNPMDKLTDNTRDLGDAARAGTPYVEDTSDAIVTVAVSSDQASTALFNMDVELQKIVDTASAVNAASTEVANAQNAILNAQNTEGGMNGGDSSGPSIMEALLGYIAGGAFFGGGNVNNTINNNNSIPNTAVADALGYRQAATLRGAR